MASEAPFLGDPVQTWTPPPVPPRKPLEGRYARLEPLDQSHAAALHDANAEDTEDRIWDYLPDGPFPSLATYHRWVRDAAAKSDPMFFAIKDLTTGRFGGVASYLRITPAAGSIEVGYITFAPRLQRTPAASEAIILMARQAFELGYRRFEWKCNALNRRSRAAAERLGFSYEGIFRQATVVKGRNRDTAWFAMIDAEYPALNAAWSQWLAPENFGPDGRQIQPLRGLTEPILAATDPSRDMP